MAQAETVARTPGATRAGNGEYVFDLAQVNHILGGPDYSTANGACVEGDIPSNAVHSGKATPDADVVFFTCKDASHSLHGIKVA